MQLNRHDENAEADGSRNCTTLSHSSRLKARTRLLRLISHAIRNGMARRMTHCNGMVRMPSSKSKVKSKPPRQAPAYGPKELSSDGEHKAASNMISR